MTLEYKYSIAVEARVKFQRNVIIQTANLAPSRMCEGLRWQRQVGAPIHYIITVTS